LAGQPDHSLRRAIIYPKEVPAMTTPRVHELSEELAEADAALARVADAAHRWAARLREQAERETVHDRRLCYLAAAREADALARVFTGELGEVLALPLVTQGYGLAARHWLERAEMGPLDDYTREAIEDMLAPA
jgi:hypothetical protein